MKRPAAIGSLCLGLLLVNLSQGQNAPDLAQIKAAAESGDAQAQDKLGAAYASHLNTTDAAVWYRKAAEQGIANSQYQLGDILMTGGFNVQKHINQQPAYNPDEAVKWFSLAANQGFKRAQTALGKCYEAGKGVKPDNVEAYKWYSLASAENVMAKTYRDSLILKMTSEQIAEGDKRAARFVVHQASSTEMPEPKFVSLLRLQSINGPANKRLAVINNQTLGVGEEFSVQVDGKSVKVYCEKIREKSVVVRVEGVAEAKELKLPY